MEEEAVIFKDERGIMSVRDERGMLVDCKVKEGLSGHEAIMAVSIETGKSYATIERDYRGYRNGSSITKKKKRKKERRGKRMIVIPDTQVKVGADTEHIRAAARYIVDHRPDVVVILGDWWDMESLSVYNSVKQAEGLRIRDDIDAGKNAMNEFMAILRGGIGKRSFPRLVFTHGNHSMAVRLPRFIEKHPELDGMIEDETTPFLEEHGFEVYPFLEVANVEGIRIAHYIQNPHSLKGSPLGGNVLTMLKNAGHSFIMGHQQTYQYHKRFLSDGTIQIGVVAGAFYPHHEDYMSPQGNEHWRGIFMLNEVKNGGGDMCEVSLNYLMEEYGDK